MKKKVLITISTVILLLLLISASYFIYWSYTTPYYLNSLFSTSTKHSVDGALSTLYAIKNLLIPTNQPVPWYPKHITVEEKKGGEFTLSFYGYLSKVVSTQGNLLVDVETQYGRIPFSLKAKQLGVEAQKNGDVEVLNEFYVTPYELSYTSIENSGEFVKTLAYKKGENIPAQTLCTGELVRVEWTTSIPPDEWSWTSGSINTKAFTGKDLQVGNISIYQGKYASQLISKRQMKDDCLKNSGGK